MLVFDYYCVKVNLIYISSIIVIGVLSYFCLYPYNGIIILLGIISFQRHSYLKLFWQIFLTRDGEDQALSCTNLIWKEHAVHLILSG